MVTLTWEIQCDHCGEVSVQRECLNFPKAPIPMPTHNRLAEFDLCDTCYEQARSALASHFVTSGPYTGEAG